MGQLSKCARPHIPIAILVLTLLFLAVNVARAESETKKATLTPRIAALPGTVQAEDYDHGNEGVAFQAARRSSVPTGYSGAALNVVAVPPKGWALDIGANEWFRYTAEVKSAGTYTVEFRVAHDIGGDPLFLLTCDGKDITGEMNAPYTGGVSKWVTLSRPDVKLTAGKHTIVLKHIGGTGFYLDWMKFTRSAPPKPGLEPALKEWELVWSDEFNRAGKPDPNKWGYDIDGHGWGNNELQYYTDRTENARVENGKLIIEARKEDFDKNHYTSARLVTRGKFDPTYGRFEISAKVPSALGSWPAIWLLGSNGKPWPANGEIDIMEHLGRNPGWIHGSAHSQKYYFKNGNQKTSIIYIPDATTAFHQYAVEWYPDHIDYFVDNNKYLTVTNEKSGWEAWPFDDPEYIILNVALGGWGGEVNDSQLPARMEVEYVRVYKHK